MKNLSVASGTYKAQDGTQKTIWKNVGKILEKDGKEFMLIDPTVNFAAFTREPGKDMVMVGIFEEQNNNQQQGQYQQPQQQNYNNQQQYQQGQQQGQYQQTQNNNYQQ